jgi:hypothetical protein
MLVTTERDAGRFLDVALRDPMPEASHAVVGALG